MPSTSSTANIKRRLLLTQSDEGLVRLVHAGHEGAFEALVHRYRRPLLRYCRRLCGCEASAEEALQQALLNAWMALARQTEVHELRAWLYQVAHNAALNCMRGERSVRAADLQHSERLAALCGVREAQTAGIDDAMALREAFAGIAALPELQREVMLRTALGGRRQDEVACELGISDDAVRGLLYRARSTLRSGLAALVPAPVLSWAARGAAGAGSGGQRVAQLAAGGSTAGLAGIAAKGGAVALTAGVAITGVLVVHRRHVPTDRRHAPAAPARVPSTTLRESAQAVSTSGARQQSVRPPIGARVALAPTAAAAPFGAHGLGGGSARRRHEASHAFGEREPAEQVAPAGSDSTPTGWAGARRRDRIGEPPRRTSHSAPEGQSAPTQLDASRGRGEDGWQQGRQAGESWQEGGYGNDGWHSHGGQDSPPQGHQDDSGSGSEQPASRSHWTASQEGHGGGRSPQD